MTEMHDVVEMLLNRIKDYPEDFVAEPAQTYGRIGDDRRWNKWQDALHTVYQVATDEEKLALDEATTDAKRAIYMGAALKTIMSEELRDEKEPDPLTYKSHGRYAVQGLQGPIGISNIANAAASSITLGNSTLTEKHVSYLEQKVKEAQIKMQRDYQNAINNA